MLGSSFGGLRVEALSVRRLLIQFAVLLEVQKVLLKRLREGDLSLWMFVKLDPSGNGNLEM